MNWFELIGKKVLVFRGIKREKYGREYIPLDYILFDDGETILEFRDQDKYDYHDCDSSARVLNLFKNVELWKQLFEMKIISAGEIGEPKDLSDPF